MPILQPKPFKVPFPQFNGHLQTIFPSQFRSIEGVNYERERIFTPDEDFLDLDWSKVGSDKIVILSHGLEGGADRHYIRGTAKVFNQEGWDACAWNCRSCSGEMNWQPRFYHHADTPDLALVIDYVLAKGYKKAVLVGYSMGGNLTLKYLGERGENVDSRIESGVAVSVPCDLSGCSYELEKPTKLFYNKRFFKRIKKKVELKASLMPDRISTEKLEKYNITSLRKFDEYYTAPLHGFKNAEVFYEEASSKNYLQTIQRPTLILSAANDPFLTPSCFPIEIAKKHKFVYLEMPKKGGHVGFMIDKKEPTYAELRALEFAQLQD